jgi:hypothetical protein
MRVRLHEAVDAVFVGLLPVAMEFHSIGDKIGRRVAMLPITPSLIMPSSVGMRPESSSGLGSSNPPHPNQ